MTTPKRTVSPYVKRALEAQAAFGWKAEAPNDATLGDAVKADELAILPEQVCAYCGLEEADGDFTFGPKGEFTLCQYCLEDKVLGACQHGGICDCLAGICDMGW
jgi:hypothetical protein